MRIHIEPEPGELEALGRDLGEAVAANVAELLLPQLAVLLRTETAAALRSMWGRARGAIEESPGQAGTGAAPAAPRPAEEVRKPDGVSESGPPPPAQGKKDVWTPERLALMRQRWPEGMPATALLQELNALPGYPVKSVASLQFKLSQLGVRRAGSNRPMPGELQRWTPERTAVLRRDWPAGVHTEVITAELNRLPGPEVTINAVRSRASRLYLARPDSGVPHSSPPTLPPPAGPRDGAPSVAARELAHDVAAALAPVPMTLDEAIAWAEQHAPHALDLKRAEFLAAVNAAREGLPPIAIMDERPGRFAPLPKASAA